MKMRMKMILYTLIACVLSLNCVLPVHAENAKQTSLVLTDWEREQTKVVSLDMDGLSERAGMLKNPERGFYHIKQFVFDNTPKGKAYWEADIGWFLQTQADSGHTISLVEIDLKNFRDGAIPDAVITDIDDMLDVWGTSGRKIIVRCLYDVNGNSIVYEPDDIDTILLHMEQLGPVFNMHKNIIFTLQGLFTGAWGEMHTTRFGSDSEMRALALKLAETTDPDIFMAVRTPAQRRAVTLNGSDVSLSRRMGLYNDGMLGSETDLGTYLENEYDTENGDGRLHREEELSYQDLVCRGVPNGGQVVEDNPYNDFENAVRDMGRMHVTYIDQYWQTTVLNKWNAVTLSDKYGAWAGKTGLDYIRDHLGYRFVMSGISLSEKDSLSRTASLSE